MAAAPQSLQTWQIQSRGHRETAQLALREGLTEAAIEELEATLRMVGKQLPGLETAELGRNLASHSLTLTPASLPDKTGGTAMIGHGELQAPHRLTSGQGQRTRPKRNAELHEPSGPVQRHRCRGHQ